MKNKILSVNKLKKIVLEEQQAGKKVACTSGCFDILHAGHVTYLEEAKSLADLLILLINSDNSVKRLKGDSRPIVQQNERAIVVAGLQCVDYVCIFDEDTPSQCLEIIQPDIFVKGGDYQGKQIPEMNVMEKYGGIVKYVSLIDGCSSTNIIEKIKRM